MSRHRKHENTKNKTESQLVDEELAGVFIVIPDCSRMPLTAKLVAAYEHFINTPSAIDGSTVPDKD